MINYMILLAVLLITLQADYKYIGCYKDNSPRALPSGPHDWGYNIASCSNACLDYTYFALQAGSWCSCGNDYGHAIKYGTATNCPSNRLGGSLANDLFRHYKHIGCYTDASPRALPSGPHNWGYNIESCADACVGYTYFALQAGSWCSCGNDYKKATDYGTSTGCPSNKLGGALANDLFIQKGINTNDWILFLERADVTDEDDWPGGDSDVYIEITGTYCENVDTYSMKTCDAMTSNQKTQKITTRTIQGSNHPVWNEQFDFGDSTRYYTKFEFCVWDEDDHNIANNPDDWYGCNPVYVGYSRRSGVEFCGQNANCKCGLQSYSIGVRLDGGRDVHGSVYFKINNPNEWCGY
eukprot:712180_1